MRLTRCSQWLQRAQREVAPKQGVLFAYLALERGPRLGHWRLQLPEARNIQRLH
jgi:hypothetical protein